MIHITDFAVRDFFPSLGWVDALTGKIREFKATFEALDSFFDQVIAEHKTGKRNSNNDQKDFIDILLQLQEDGLLDFELTHQNLKALIMDMFLGGSDSSSSLLEWTFTELLKNPISMKKAQEELPATAHGESAQALDMTEVYGLFVSKKLPIILQPIPYSHGYT
ncbi:hypothetical protein L6164_016600 [Bauhinia variegata]|uniref:Uncharacterized protein n=1 Tax=Bauhinia variegata TaxID=167791 RepID=A0ACB9NPG3_BAUVA|nr:hypothetical protein L6164_016600 [Bauhinia variegata]